jgi:hypothetical protein
MTLADGRSFERDEPVNWGNPENPMKPEDVEKKFRRNAGRVMPEDKLGGIVSAVFNLDAEANAEKLVSACCEG